MLSQSTYFQLSTSRLGSLEIDDGQRPKSEELRPGECLCSQEVVNCGKTHLQQPIQTLLKP